MNRAVLSLVILFCFVAFSCGHKPTPTPPPVPVNIMTATAQHVTYFDKYPATTVALAQVNLSAQVTGYITGIYFTEGAHVTKGQRLYSLDERLYQAAVDQARANLRVDSGILKQTKQDADRYTYLAKYNAIATQVVDHAVISYQNAVDSVKAAQQQLKTALTNLTYASIYAPFDGTIGISQVRLGNLVSPGTTVLNTISSDDPMAVDFVIPEAQLPHMEDLQKNKQHDIDSLFTIILPNGQVYPQLGKIAIIDRAVDPQTGTITVRLTFPNKGYYLRPGMSTIVRVHNQDEAPQIVVPSRAVVEQMGEFFLFVAKDTVLKSSDTTAKAQKADTAETPKLRAFQKKVQLGQTIGANVIVRSGINEGDKIIVDGVQAIHEGSQINASSKPQDAAGSQGAGANGGGANSADGKKGNDSASAGKRQQQ